MSLTNKLISLRREKGFTQTALAEKMDVSRQSISRWELGEAFPSTDNLRRLSELYGVSVDYLMNDDEQLPKAAVAVMEEPELENTKEKNVKKSTLLGIAIGLAVALMIALIAGAFFAGYKKGVKDTTPTYPIHTDELDSMNFEGAADLVGW